MVAGTSANAEIGTALVRLRDRSRDLVRNNPYAAKAAHAVVSNLVGTGIMPRARAGDAAVNDRADRLWARFAEACDADGLTDFSGLQALIVRAMVESGECLVRIRERRIEDGLAVPLQLQLLEPDHLDAGKTDELPGGGFVVQGVEFDALGRRRAYWLYPVHPGEVAMFRRAALVSQPVPAASVLHLFDRLRPGQVRGVPWFAPVILKLRDLDDYDDAELVRKKIEACFAAFVTGSDDEETLGRASADADCRRVESFEPGMIEYLAPGKDVKFATPSHAGGHAPYMRVQLHAIAAGVGAMTLKEAIARQGYDPAHVLAEIGAINALTEEPSLQKALHVPAAVGDAVDDHAVLEDPVDDPVGLVVRLAIFGHPQPL